MYLINKYPEYFVINNKCVLFLVEGSCYRVSGNQEEDEQPEKYYRQLGLVNLKLGQTLRSAGLMSGKNLN